MWFHSYLPNDLRQTDQMRLNIESDRIPAARRFKCATFVCIELLGCALRVCTLLLSTLPQ